MKKIARSLLFLITLFIVGSTVLPVSADAQPYRYRHHRRYYRHHHYHHYRR